MLIMTSRLVSAGGDMKSSHNLSDPATISQLFQLSLNHNKTSLNPGTA